MVVCVLNRDNKLHITFHDPNDSNDTIKFLNKMVADMVVEKYFTKNSLDGSQTNLLSENNVL